MGRAQAFYAKKLNATFPDAFGTETSTGRHVSLELKVPRDQTVGSFFRNPRNRFSILEQHGGCLEHMPDNTVAHLVVDLRSTGQTRAKLSPTFRRHSVPGDKTAPASGMAFGSSLARTRHRSLRQPYRSRSNQPRGLS